MNSQLDFEEKVKKLMKSRINREAAATMDFLPEGKKCTWINAMCLSLANKAVKGDINAIKYINENVFLDDNGCGGYWWEIADKDKLLDILKEVE